MPIPTEEEVLGYFKSLSNWGRWGEQDEFGTLNHITEKTPSSVIVGSRPRISSSR